MRPHPFFRTGEQDLILTQLPLQSADTEGMRLFSEPLKLVMARDHAFAQALSVWDVELVRQNVLTLSSAHRFMSKWPVYATTWAPTCAANTTAPA